jgi:uncharacterized protein (DUF58 family)
MTELKRIKTKLSIHSRKRSVLMLEGEYVSSLQGKSLDFDDLREYVYGDDVRDIDWRASAKQQVPLVKRYVANRKHNVLFVYDSSATMLAATPEYQPKYELASEVVGVLGYIAVKHNDNVGLLTISNNKLERIPFKGGENHVNRILDSMEKATVNNQEAISIEQLLTQANLMSRNRTIMVIIANEAEPSLELEQLIKKLQNKHDVIWVSIADINPITIPREYDVVDVIDIINIPDGLRMDQELMNNVFLEREAKKQELNEFLKALRTSHLMLSASADTIPSLITMLKRRENGKRI